MGPACPTEEHWKRKVLKENYGEMEEDKQEGTLRFLEFCRKSLLDQQLRSAHLELLLNQKIKKLITKSGKKGSHALLIDPPPSHPIATGTKLAETTAALPLDEPPVSLLGS